MKRWEPEDWIMVLLFGSIGLALVLAVIGATVADVVGKCTP